MLSHHRHQEVPPHAMAASHGSRHSDRFQNDDRRPGPGRRVSEMDSMHGQFGQLSLRPDGDVRRAADYDSFDEGVPKRRRVMYESWIATKVSDEMGKLVWGRDPWAPNYTPEEELAKTVRKWKKPVSVEIDKLGPKSQKQIRLLIEDRKIEDERYYCVVAYIRPEYRSKPGNSFLSLPKPVLVSLEVILKRTLIRDPSLSPRSSMRGESVHWDDQPSEGRNRRNSMPPQQRPHFAQDRPPPGRQDSRQDVRQEVRFAPPHADGPPHHHPHTPHPPPPFDRPHSRPLHIAPPHHPPPPAGPGRPESHPAGPPPGPPHHPPPHHPPPGRHPIHSPDPHERLPVPPGAFPTQHEDGFMGQPPGQRMPPGGHDRGHDFRPPPAGIPGPHGGDQPHAQQQPRQPPAQHHASQQGPLPGPPGQPPLQQRPGAPGNQQMHPNGPPPGHPHYQQQGRPGPPPGQHHPPAGHGHPHQPPMHGDQQSRPPSDRGVPPQAHRQGRDPQPQIVHLGPVSPGDRFGYGDSDSGSSPTGSERFFDRRYEGSDTDVELYDSPDYEHSGPGRGRKHQSPHGFMPPSRVEAPSPPGRRPKVHHGPPVTMRGFDPRYHEEVEMIPGRSGYGRHPRRSASVSARPRLGMGHDDRLIRRRSPSPDSSRSGRAMSGPLSPMFPGAYRETDIERREEELRIRERERQRVWEAKIRFLKDTALDLEDKKARLEDKELDILYRGGKGLSRRNSEHIPGSLGDPVYVRGHSRPPPIDRIGGHYR